MSRTVVILGAGVGGLSTAARLRELLPDADRVVVVDRSPTSVQGLSLLWLLRGWRKPEEVRVTPSALDTRGIEFVHAEVERVLPAERQVHTSQGVLSYDALVVALGAVADPALFPGLAEAVAAGSAGHYNGIEAATALHEKLTQVQGGRVALMVSRLPFRCPAAPSETALLVADLLTETGVREGVQIDLYTPEPLPMPVAGPVLGKALVGMLEQHGITFHPTTTVSHVDPAARELRLDSGESVGFDFLIAVPPHQPPAPVAELGFSEAGWIPVDARTLTTSAQGVWALGDVSATTLPVGKPLPKAGVLAQGQAVAVADGIARHLGADAPEPYFDGYGHCYVELGGGLAAKGAGNFLLPDGPEIVLQEPSAQFHQDKEHEERDWIRRWSSAA